MYGGTEAACEDRAAGEVVVRPVAAASKRRRAARPAESLTDGELVTLALNGASPAFDRLLERHARHMRRLIAGRLRDPDDVLDVIQDTRLAVWRALRYYDARRPFEAWLTSIALNKCRDWARRRTSQATLRVRLEADAAEGVELACREHDLERRLILEERLLELARALDGLPSQLRTPLVLTTLGESSQDGAARELGLTRKAVEMRVRRARQHLAQALRSGRPGA